MKELLDMELVGDNFFVETVRGQSRHSGIVLEKLE
jgi:hypothetical protein